MFTRTVNRSATSGGKICGASSQTQVCNAQVCDVDCVMEPDFEAWGACSRTCGGGTEIRHRNVTVQPSGNGLPCPEVTCESRSCNTHGCACAHIKCEYAMHASGHSRIRVLHDRNELVYHHHKYHKCKWDRVDSQCECECFESEAQMEQWEAHVWIPTAGSAEQKCTNTNAETTIASGGPGHHLYLANNGVWTKDKSNTFHTGYVHHTPGAAGDWLNHKVAVGSGGWHARNQARDGYERTSVQGGEAAANTSSLLPHNEVINVSLKVAAAAFCDTETGCGSSSIAARPRWQITLDSTAADNSQINGDDLVIEGDNGNRFSIWGVSHIAYLGTSFYFWPCADTASYTASMLTTFNSLFPVGTRLEVKHATNGGFAGFKGDYEHDHHHHHDHDHDHDHGSDHGSDHLHDHETIFADHPQHHYYGNHLVNYGAV